MIKHCLYSPSDQGQIPYIELNGKEIPDSNIIIGNQLFPLLPRCILPPPPRAFQQRRSLGTVGGLMTAFRNFWMEFRWEMLAARLKRHFNLDPDSNVSKKFCSLLQQVSFFFVTLYLRGFSAYYSSSLNCPVFSLFFDVVWTLFFFLYS